MPNIGEAVVILEMALPKWRPGNTQRGILCELRQQEGEVVPVVERYVCIEVADDVVSHASEQVVARIECIYLSGKVSLVPVRYPKKPNPRMVLQITFNDLIRAIGRTIADNDPRDRQASLGNDRFDGQPDEL